MECFHKSGTYTKENYSNGLLDGHSEWSEESGMVYQRVYSHGLENGPAKDIFPNGDILEYNYVNGRVQGKSNFYQNNRLVETCDFDDREFTNCSYPSD